MQETESEQTTPTLPTSQPLAPMSIVQVNESDDDPDEIFFNAVSEIDTQPLKRERLTIADVLEIGFLVSVLLFGLLGSFYFAITYPHTLVILYAKAKSTSITATIAIPTRTLAPVTVTRSQTAPTTGTGYQSARAATGQLTFYNGLFTPQTIPIGTVFTGRDGIKVTTAETITIAAADPIANPPQDVSIASVPSRAIATGAAGNIAVEDIDTKYSNGVSVKNTSAFTKGRDARTFRAVAPQDVTTLTSTLRNDLAQQIPRAFSLQPGEGLQTTNCTTKTTADHATGAEATTLTVTMSTTCQGVAYSQVMLTKKATAAFTQTKPAANYHIVGSVHTTLQSVTPFTVALSGKWTYTFTQDYKQHLAEQIAGDTPARAKAYLLKTGVISYASVPATLPSADYINFLVLVG